MILEIQPVYSTLHIYIYMYVCMKMITDGEQSHMKYL